MKFFFWKKNFWKLFFLKKKLKIFLVIQSAAHGILNCLNHAGYKALLFLLAGMAIHKNESNAKGRRSGNGPKRSPQNFHFPKFRPGAGPHGAQGRLSRGLPGARGKKTPISQKKRDLGGWGGPVARGPGRSVPRAGRKEIHIWFFFGPWGKFARGRAPGGGPGRRAGLKKGAIH